MKGLRKWFFRVTASVATCLLVIALLPQALRLAELFQPDLSELAETASQLLTERFQDSARLETQQIETEGVLSSSTNALFVGTVQQVTVHYLYEASLGIDLQAVSITVDGGTLTLTIPPVEVLADGLTPLSIERNDFWYPLTDRQRETLLEGERLACRERYQEEYAQSEECWSKTCRMLDATIAEWLSGTSGLKIAYERATATE